MHIKFSIFHSCKCRDRRAIPEVVAPISFTSFNLREEYANAFRTESYNEFWARVTDLTFAYRSADSANESKENSAAARLPSYRLFTDHLLEPDQPTVEKILDRARNSDGEEHHVINLLSDYFAETANASLLCGVLLRDIEQIRLRHRPLKTTLNSHNLQDIADHLADLSQTHYNNPFSSLAPSQLRFQSVQTGSSSLLKRLELSRKKARARLRLASRLRRGLAVFLVALTASTSVVGIYVALHVLVALAALPVFLPAVSFRLGSTRWQARVLAHLDAATKGAYILNRDLDTISRLVARLHDEVEHMLAMLRFCSERRRERLRPTREVVRQLKKNDASFNQQLDELEEHLYLCFMTINKARRLVVKEVLVPTRV